MGILGKILGSRDEPKAGTTAPARVPAQAPGVEPEPERDPDAVAVERYRHILRTVPADTIKRAHAEAFAALTPEQRGRVLADLSAAVPESDRVTSDDPDSLARMATRAEMREPGTLERTFGSARDQGAGDVVAGTLLVTVAIAFLDTSIASALMSDAYEGGRADSDGGETTQDVPETGREGTDTGREGDDTGDGDDGGGDGD